MINSAETSTNFALLPGTVLNSDYGKYNIIRVLGMGGFGITYLVEGRVKVGNISIKSLFALKEFFVNTMCDRMSDSKTVTYSQHVMVTIEQLRQSFIKEAHRVHDLGIEHPNIIKINEVFEANNTAYYIMEYLEGQTLQDFVKQHGPLSHSDARTLIKPIAEAVAAAHRIYLTHYDIKPDNIILAHNDDGSFKPTLIDFGLAKHYDDFGNPTSTLGPTGYSLGYAPIEQYAGLKEFTPQADVYGLGATLYFCLIGKHPAEATQFNVEEAKSQLIDMGIPLQMVNGLGHAMQMLRQNRTETAELFLNETFLDNSIDYNSTQKIFINNDIPEKYSPTLIHLAEIGIAKAQFLLAKCYDTGDGITRDERKAILWYRKAAEQGNAEAQTKVGKFYYFGWSTKQDYEEAVWWFRKAAEQGNAEAQFNLGVCLFDGKGISKNYIESVSWYLKAAKQGYVEAQNNLGWAYSHGVGVSKDAIEAVKWYRLAAEQNDADAQYNLGWCYANGKGVKKDYIKAFKWFQIAAVQNVADAQYYLGWCYANGKGVARNHAEAVNWYRKAAEQGHKKARKELSDYGLLPDRKPSTLF